MSRWPFRSMSRQKEEEESLCLASMVRSTEYTIRVMRNKECVYSVRLRISYL